MELNKAIAIALAKGLRLKEINKIKLNYLPEPFEMDLRKIQQGEEKAARAILKAVGVLSDANARQILDEAWRQADDTARLRLALAEQYLKRANQEV